MGALAGAKINTSRSYLLERENVSHRYIFAEGDEMRFVVISDDVIVSV